MDESVSAPTQLLMCQSTAFTLPDGYNAEGFDKDGFNEDGVDIGKPHRTAVVGLLTTSLIAHLFLLYLLLRARWPRPRRIGVLRLGRRQHRVFTAIEEQRRDEEEVQSKKLQERGRGEARERSDCCFQRAEAGGGGSRSRGRGRRGHHRAAAQALRALGANLLELLLEARQDSPRLEGEAPSGHGRGEACASNGAPTGQGLLCGRDLQAPAAAEEEARRGEREKGEEKDRENECVVEAEESGGRRQRKYCHRPPRGR